MNRVPGICFLIALTICSAPAADEAIDRLINKLPPPQKFVDPAISDPLAKRIQPALKAHNYGVALDLSRRLAKKYPKSLGSQMMHGFLAFSFRNSKEAMDAYQAAISIRSDFPPAYVGMGVTNIAQNRFDAALASFQRVTRLLPQADVGWIGCSICAEKLGQKRDSLEFARRATSVAPTSIGAWMQAAHEESLAGNVQAANADLARAKDLQKKVARAKK